MGLSGASRGGGTRDTTSGPEWENTSGTRTLSTRTSEMDVWRSVCEQLQRFCSDCCHCRRTEAKEAPSLKTQKKTTSSE